MIVVTGAAGFIGSNLIKKLNILGHNNIIAVDDLTDGAKFVNLVDCQIASYVDKDEFFTAIVNEQLLYDIEVIFHQGACSATTEWNGKFMMSNNYEYSKQLLHYCQQHDIQFIYASSASVYGNNSCFTEHPNNEKPLNVYGYSKLLFDQYAMAISAPSAQIVGLRYFNVYGPREQHKGSMASVAFHFNNQIKETGECRLFEGDVQYANGGQLRDFVYVGDIVDVNIWFWQQANISGVFNCGTGKSQSFNDVANAVIKANGQGKIRYIPFPDSLKGCYQSFTQADLTKLRAVGYTAEFKTVEQAVPEYCQTMSVK